LTTTSSCDLSSNGFWYAVRLQLTELRDNFTYSQSSVVNHSHTQLRIILISSNRRSALYTGGRGETGSSSIRWLEMSSLFQKCQKELMLNFKMIRQDIKDKRRYSKCHAKWFQQNA